MEQIEVYVKIRCKKYTVFNIVVYFVVFSSEVNPFKDQVIKFRAMWHGLAKKGKFKHVTQVVC